LHAPEHFTGASNGFDSYRECVLRRTYCTRARAAATAAAAAAAV
jgi:hypothetical protein